MSEVEQIRPNSNPIQAKLLEAINTAVQATILEHPNQLTYIEIVGALALTQADYSLEHQATQMSYE